jgi:hypothetical protein
VEGHKVHSFPFTQSQSPHCPFPPSTPVHLQIAAPSLLSFSVLFNTFISNPLFHRSQHSTRSYDQFHISETHTPPSLFSFPHGVLKFLIAMATHGPINGVKINRACSGSLGTPPPFPFLFPFAAHRMCIPFLATVSPNPESIVVPFPSLYCSLCTRPPVVDVIIT